MGVRRRRRHRRHRRRHRRRRRHHREVADRHRVLWESEAQWVELSEEQRADMWDQSAQEEQSEASAAPWAAPGAGSGRDRSAERSELFPVRVAARKLEKVFAEHQLHLVRQS